MAKTNLLNTRITNFLELVGNGSIDRVPCGSWVRVTDLRGAGCSSRPEESTVAAFAELIGTAR